MYKQIIPVLALLLGASSLHAQTPAPAPPPPPAERRDESIIIRKKGDTKEKTTVVIDGDKVTINGKPLEEFKSDDVDVMVSKNRNRVMVSPRAPMTVGGVKMFRYNKAFLGLTSEKTDGGVKVTEVRKDSPAEKAGLKKDDIITKIGDTKIEDTDDLYDAVGKLNADSKVDITYKRSGKESKATATLEKNKEMAYTYKYDSDHYNVNIPSIEVPGFNFNGNFSRKPRVGIQIQDTEDSNGVKILDVDEETPAAKAGLHKDDVITGVNGKAVKSVGEVKEALDDVKEGDTVKFSYKRNNQAQTAEVKLPKRLRTSNL